ncbi:MAG: glycogen debranching protein [Sphingobacteriales bacterium]
MKFHLLCLPLCLSSLLCGAQNRPVYQSKAYTIYPDRVVQRHNKAIAISATEITSNYRSPADEFQSPVIDFKFSINGKDNEMIPDKNHHFNCIAKNGINETPFIKFGQQSVDNRPIPAGTYLKPGSILKIRLDMRDVLSAFKTQGYYVCFNGDKIYKDDFKGVFIAGKPSPLIWDFNNLVNHPELKLKDPDGDGIYETTLIIGGNDKKTASSWKLSKDISAFPQYHSGYKLSDGIYNMSLEEMQKAVEPDSTFRTGKEWGGVWTRDISYSIILSMAILQPKVAVYSLMRKVKNGRVIQDTGTGGAYPVSSDRMIWAVAAWEVYKVTGDKDWLAKAYQIIKNSVTDDERNIYDPITGLVHGESSFLDWREETYPKWMQPADIYESECLGTNVVHYQVNKVLAAMARVMNDPDASKYDKQAAVIKKGIQTNLWQPEKGYYGQYLYGRNFKSLSPRSEALGEALSVYFGVADENEQKSVISHTPVNEFGIPCIYPQIPGIPPYHNSAVWPFVETYWAIASAKAGNEASVLRAISAIYRPAALWLTNKENFVVSDGDYAGTQINSSNMLWSLSGNIALVYKVLFGISYNDNSLQFNPFVPKTLSGNRSLQHFKYRNADLNITMQGYGNQVKTITLDGKPLHGGIISSDISGEHKVEIILANNVITGTSNLQPDYTAPETPVVTYKKGYLSWQLIKNAVSYHIIKNGKYLSTSNVSSLHIPTDQYAEYQVAAVDVKGISSFNSEPVAIIPSASIQIIEAENAATVSTLPYKGFSGNGFIEISKTQNTIVNIPVNITNDGYYAINFKYANGNGPINTENKCAIRTLTIDGDFKGTIVFPQRGKEEWSNWGFSNSVKVKLSKGRHIVSLQFKPANENMNGDINQAMVDFIQVIRLY